MKKLQKSALACAASLPGDKLPRNGKAGVLRKKMLPSLISALALLPLQVWGQEAAQSGQEAELQAVTVQAEAATGQATEKTQAYTVRRTASAAGLDLSLRETPQSVTVVTRALMDDFGLNTINDALEGVTGINVERVETDRFYYTARGFDINNFQVDGIGVPLTYGNVVGDLDTVIYDRIDVVRGATGLVSGAGNPSAAINFVRKRPTGELQASAELTYGAWNDMRLEGDISGALNASGSVRGRLVAAYQDRESYLDYYSADKDVLYGVLEADIGANTMLTVGHTLQRNRPQGVLWGALPLYYDDGTPTDYDVSTSNSAEWTYWDTSTTITFAELQHQFANGWQGRAVYTHKTLEDDSKLLYMYGTPVAGTDTGLFAWPAVYQMKNEQDIVDLRVNGPFTLAGREHELVFGASFSRSDVTYAGFYGDSLGTPVSDPYGGSFPEPVFNIPAGGANFEDRQRSFYAAAKLQTTDKLKAVLGVNYTHVESNGVNFGEDQARDESKATPYAGLIYDLTREVSAYASHTQIFMPQSEIGSNYQPLAPAEGYSNEVGLKGEWLDKRLHAALSVFKAKQAGLAEYDYFDIATGQSIYRGVDTHSQGFEAEIGGEVIPGVKLAAGYSQVEIKDDAGNDVRTYTPRQLFNFSSTWQVAPRLKLGGRLNWKDQISVDQGAGVVVTRPAYALLDLMAQYKIDKHWTASLNVNNVTDEKYLTSLMWGQSYYGAPRNVSVSLNWKY